MRIPIDLAVGGVGARALELDHGIESISHLMSLWELATLDSIVLRVSLELLQLKVSAADLALNKPFLPRSHLSTP